MLSRTAFDRVGDEGGFAPNLKSNEEACELIVEAIRPPVSRPAPNGHGARPCCERIPR